MKELLNEIICDPRYQRNIRYGTARKGHPEDTVAAHIAQLESNLDTLLRRGRISDD